MFRKDISIKEINEACKDSLIEFLEIEVTELGDNFLKGRMPVNNKVKQRFGYLHGGASVAFAESLGSIAATCIEKVGESPCFGLDINANHIKAVRDGYVYGIASPFHIGKSTQVWEIKITNEEGELVCISRLTMAVLNK